MKQKIPNIGSSTICFVAGSDSDLEKMKDMFEIVERSGITFELHVISADRNPEEIDDFCRNVMTKQITKVIVTVAGLSAVLASAIKSRVGIIPVLAAPLDEDSLRSNISKPKGTVVGVCGAIGKNACYNTTVLACEIVAAFNPDIAENLRAFTGIKRGEKQAQYDIDVELVREKYKSVNK